MVDRFFLQIVGSSASGEVAMSVRNDLPIDAVGMTSPTDDIGLHNPNHEALRDGVLKENPTLKEMIEHLILAADIWAEVSNEFDQHVQYGTTFWSHVLTGDGLESAQRNAHHVQRMVLHRSLNDLLIN